jgi:hypothetical protein
VCLPELHAHASTTSALISSILTLNRALSSRSFTRRRATCLNHESRWSARRMLNLAA